MVDGIRGLTGPLAQLLVGAVSVTEQGLVTAHHRLMGVMNARLTVQMPLQQKPATTAIAQLMVDGIRGLTGPLAQLLVGAVSVTEQGLVPAHCQLMEVAIARTTAQVTLRQKPATTTIAQVSDSL